jgi:hypothetical protein
MNSTSLTSGSRTLKGRATRPWQFFLTASFLAAAAAVWVAPPTSPIALLFLSLAVAAAGACATALHAVLTALAGNSAPETRASGSVRETLEREKLLTLRSLKDLEFDRQMGKVSATDAAPLEARLRARAMAIMRELDGRDALRARVETDLAARSDSGLPNADSRLQTPDSRPVTCASCATVNDPDANFCKSCGTRL